MARPHLRVVAAQSSQADAEELVLDDVFAALSDPVRRAILTQLDEGELLVSELAAPFDISLQAVSKHIQVLVRAGLVSQERTGRISRCRLDAGPICTAAVWLNRYSKYWQAQFEFLAASLADLDDAEAKTRRSRRKEGARRAGSGRRIKSKSKNKS